jgi:hypothetical protein
MMTATLTAQERSASGRIYNDLLPFVGLEGVRIEIRGLGVGIIDNTIGAPGRRAELTLTGLSRAQESELDRTIRSDITLIFRDKNIPLLASGPTASETRPLLLFNLTVTGVKTNEVFIQVRTALNEAAKLVKDPSRTVWTQTWGTSHMGLFPTSNLQTTLRNFVQGHVSQFASLYARAHAKP